MHQVTLKVHEGLQNCFEGTKMEKVHRPTEEGATKKSKAAKVAKVNHYAEVTLPQNTNLVDQIMQATQFTLKAVKVKKTKNRSKSKKKKEKRKADEVINEIEVPRMMDKPIFRCVPDRATMQRLVMRYVGMKDDFKGFRNDAEDENSLTRVVASSP
jgi:hypothetical protein